MARRKRTKPKHEDPVVQQLDHLKRLMMLQLVVSGVKAKDIAKVLGVTNSAISAIIPARTIQKLGA